MLPANPCTSGRPHRTPPSLRLNAHYVQAQLVFLDDAVDASIARSTDRLSGVDERATVAHRHEQYGRTDETLEECRRASLQPLQQLVCDKSVAESLVRRLNLLFRRARFQHLIDAGHFFAVSSALGELDVAGELTEEDQVDSLRLALKNRARLEIGDADVSPRLVGEQASHFHVSLRPRDPIGEDGLLAARKKFLLLLVGEIEMSGEAGRHFPHGVILAIG